MSAFQRRMMRDAIALTLAEVEQEAADERALARRISAAMDLKRGNDA